MAYSTSNPPKCLVPGVGGGPGIWVYTSADTRTTVEGGSYFSNATALGMKVGDVVVVIVTPGYLATTHAVTAISLGAATVNAAVLS